MKYFCCCFVVCCDPQRRLTDTDWLYVPIGGGWMDARLLPVSVLLFDVARRGSIVLPVFLFYCFFCFFVRVLVRSFPFFCFFSFCRPQLCCFVTTVFVFFFVLLLLSIFRYSLCSYTVVPFLRLLFFCSTFVCFQCFGIISFVLSCPLVVVVGSYRVVSFFFFFTCSSLFRFGHWFHTEYFKIRRFSMFSHYFVCFVFCPLVVVVTFLFL